MLTSKLQSISSDGHTLAVSQPNGIIKFYDVDSVLAAKVVHEFQPAEHLQAQPTCLRFLRGKKVNSFSHDEILAISNVTGSIIIYNVGKHKIVSVLNHSKRSPVTDLAWEGQNCLISLAKDKSMVFWDACTGKKLRKVTVDGYSSLCVLGPQTYVAAGVQLQVLKNEESSPSTFNYQGHSTDVEHLVPVVINAHKVARYFLSASKDSRVFYAWLSDFSKGEPQNRPVRSFAVKDMINTIECHQLSETTSGVSVTTRKGYMRFFTNHFNGITNKTVKPVSFQSELQIVRNDVKTKIPILGSYFLSSEKLLIFYGSLLFIKFEVLNVSMFCNCEEPSITLTRADPSLVQPDKHKSVMKTLTPQVSAKISFLQQTAVEISQNIKSSKRKRDASVGAKTLGQELDEINLIESSSAKRPNRLMNHKAKSLHEGLLSNNETEILAAIDSGCDERIMNSTVKELSPSLALLFLNYLSNYHKNNSSAKFQRKRTIIRWMQSIVTNFMQHFDATSLYEFSRVVCSYYATREPLINSFKALDGDFRTLNIRINKPQVENITEDCVNPDQEPLTVFMCESSSDDESEDEESMATDENSNSSELDEG